MTPGQVLKRIASARRNYSDGVVSQQELLDNLAEAVESLAAVLAGDPLGEPLPSDPVQEAIREDESALEEMRQAPGRRQR